MVNELRVQALQLYKNDLEKIAQRYEKKGKVSDQTLEGAYLSLIQDVIKK